MSDHYSTCNVCFAARAYHPEEVAYTCPACGPLGVLEVHYDYEQVAQRISRVTLE